MSDTPDVGLIKASWNPQWGTPLTITYSFETYGSDGIQQSYWENVVMKVNGIIPGTFASLSFDQKFAFTIATLAWESVADVRILAAAPGQGDIAIALADFNPAPDGSIIEAATIPIGTRGANSSGDMVFNKLPAASNDELAPGQTGFNTFIHELGHALGLDHPFGRGGYDLSQKFTVMSYIPVKGIPGFTDWWASKPMLYDILAIQSLYGVNPLAPKDDGNKYEFKTGIDAIQAIWDAGGDDDSIDASDQTDSVTIDLTPGHFSFVGDNEDTSQQQIAIAFQVTGQKDSWIENAKGGSGKDKLIGNDADNELDGGDEADTLEGGKGNDTYHATNGDTIMDSDGQGEVWFGSMKLKGGMAAGFYWQPQYAPDDDYHYHKIANTLIFTSDGHEEFVLIRNFENNDLGIHLNGDVKERVLKDFAWVYKIDSPIALDLNGDGLATTRLNRSASYFDYDANGFAELTGWLNNQDGFLVLDRNGNGIIDNGLELFGSQTLLSNGAYAANGYEALAELDENSDGFIDAQDSIYTSLGVWQDQNGNGKSEANELFNLPLAKVQSIGIGYTDSDLNDQGNTIKQIGTFTKTDGTSGQSGDIWFQTNDVYSIAASLLPETPEIASLPNVSGYRNVYDLHQTMLRDTTGQLQALVQAFVDTPAAERLAWVNPIIFAWAGIGDLSPDSRGPNVDARELAVLEFFTGQHFYQLNGSNGGAIDNPGANSATAINGIFDRFTAAVYQQLLESHFAPELNRINVIGSPSGFEYDFTEMTALLQAMYEQDNRGVPELIVFSNTLLNIFDGRSRSLENLRALGDLNTGFSGMLGRMGYINLLGDANDNVLSSSNFQDDILLGMAGDDQLSGKGGSDWLQGGVGNDTLDGGSGNDAFIFSRGDGRDEIIDGKAGTVDIETVEFTDVASTDVGFSRPDGSDDLRLTYGNGDQVLVNGFFGANATDGRTRFFFSDGVALTTYADVLALLPSSGNTVPALTGALALLAGGSEDTVRMIAAAELLQGYTDADGDALSVAALIADSGNLVDHNDGTWTFTPAGDFNGTVVLSYNVIDGNGGSVAVGQRFRVAAVNDTPTGAVLMTGLAVEGHSLFADATQVEDADGLGVLNYQWLADNQIISGANADSYLLGADDIGKAISVQISYRDGGNTTENVTSAATSPVLGLPRQSAPVANDDSIVTEEEKALKVNVLANDTDADGDTLTLSAFDATSSRGGHIALNVDGTLTYTPKDDFIGTDSFTYKITDGLAESNPATVRIIVVDDDPIKSSASITLPNSALDLVLTGKADIDGVGNGWDNRIIGNKGNNVLDGKAGNDRLEGKEGKDILIGGTGNDTLKGGDGKDTYLFTRNDIQAGGVDKAYDSKGDALDLTALLSDIRIDGVGLDAITKNFVLGDSLSRAAGHETSLAFIDGKLLFDLDRDGRFSPDSDFQIALTGVNKIAFNANTDLLSLA